MVFTITNTFQNIIDESKHKQKKQKTIIDKGSKFCNRLQKNNIEMYSTHNEGKSVKPDTFTLIHDFSIEKCVYWQVG